MSNNFDQFMQEVETDLRHEKFEKLWKQYGKFIAGAFIVLISLSALYNFWSNHQTKQRNIISHQFSNAQTQMLNRNFGDAIVAMEGIAQKSHPTYAALAKLCIAAMVRQDSGHRDLDKAEAIYQGLMNDKKIDFLMRDLATVFYVSLKLDRMSMDNQEELKKCQLLIDPISKKQGSYKYIALEQKGLIEFRLKNYKAAADNFVIIAQEEKAPRDIKLRAQMMTQHLASLIANGEGA